MEKADGELNSKAKIICSGALFYAKDTNRILLVQKARGKHIGTWGLVGGTNEEYETPWQGLQREIQEEIGILPNIIKTLPLETFVSSDNVFNFHTYMCVIDHEFIPKLSDEHIAYAWCTLVCSPKPLHQGLRASFSNRIIRDKLQTIFDVMQFI